MVSAFLSLKDKIAILPYSFTKILAVSTCPLSRLCRTALLFRIRQRALEAAVFLPLTYIVTSKVAKIAPCQKNLKFFIFPQNQ